jgi:phenol 2-monooxygenase
MSLEAGYMDVLIIGGGPVGLVTASALQKMNVSAFVIGEGVPNLNVLSHASLVIELITLQERLYKDKMPIYGRACSLFPRTLEFLDQLDLLDEFTQSGFIGRNGVNYNKDGKQVNGTGWQKIFSRMNGSTYLNFYLNLRLKYSERMIQNAYEKFGGDVAVGWQLRSLSLDPEAKDGYKVSAVVRAVESDQFRTLKRYDLATSAPL